jgi:hypothetical protein
MYEVEFEIRAFIIQNLCRVIGYSVELPGVQFHGIVWNNDEHGLSFGLELFWNQTAKM